MKNLKQKFEVINGVNKAICPLCGKPVFYPDGIYTRKGIEIHSICISEQRKKSIKEVL
jgi:hypothetical protein